MKLILSLVFLTVIFSSCSKSSDSTSSPAGVATISTTAIASITTTTAISGGNVGSDGGATVTARGVCWSSSPGAVVSNSHSTDGSGTGSFVSTLSGLAPFTRYYVRAYATNSAGTAYGAEVNFKTAATIPSLISSSANFITNTTAVAGGNISSDNGFAVTARGICWSTSPSPVVSGTHTTDGTGTGIFISAMTGLNANTTYYVRPYATNSAGTSYGNEFSFTTSPTVVPNVYIGGRESNATFHQVAKIWRNGIATSLTNGLFDAEVTSLFVDGTDVYAVGDESNGTNRVVKLWKNGVATSLTNGAVDAYATSVFVSNGDVYVAGNESNGTPYFYTPRIWKNGVLMPTLYNGNRYGHVASIYVSGPDVYACGGALYGSIYHLRIWKNGTITNDTLVTNESVGNSIAVSASDVYVAGYNFIGPTYKATLWKNGTGTSLSPDSSQASSVFVSGSDVYVGGWLRQGGFTTAKIWKNGIMASLPSQPRLSAVEALYVFGGDTYACGEEIDNAINNGIYEIAKFWKNGTPINLTNGSLHAFSYAVFVSNF